MARKRLTQILPWLKPLRRRQRVFCFYLKMKLDRRHYAEAKSDGLLPYQLFESSCLLYNEKTGFDMIYQENKVHNLKLAASAIDKLLIRPGETFSFCKATRYADRYIPYKNGLSIVDGKLVTVAGGGMCQMSNLLFWLFLHSPLTIVERHGHGMKDFPDPPSDAPTGVDATIYQGWMDLKVKNGTAETFQINIGFDHDNIIGYLFTDKDMGITYRIENGGIIYYRVGESVFEEVDIIKKLISKETGECIISEKLYRNKCEIGYQLPDNTQIIEEEKLA